MTVRVDRSFEKDTDRIKDQKLLSRVADCISEVIAAEDLTAVRQVKKMKGFRNHYRV